MNRLQPQSGHAGITLAEVLIAMGILTVGLLGVAAVFPVGGHYMQTGEIADRASAIAQAALEDAIIRGHLDPENWTMARVDPVLNMPPVAVLSKQFAPSLRETFGVDAGTLAALSAIPESEHHTYYRGSYYGGAYVIDPLGFASQVETINWPPTLADSASVRRFPATIGSVGYNVSGPGPGTWRPWNAEVGFGPFIHTWPVRRVTTTQTAPQLSGIDAGRTTRAAALFTTTDDLALTLPDNGDEPARQRVESLTAGSLSVASARQARGDYSWILTVAPSSNAARDTFATQPDAYPVDVSAAVFYKRQIGRTIPDAQEAERLVTAQVVSTSPGGGEMLLTRNSGDGVNVGPFEDLRGGHYLMVVGPHPQSTGSQPRLVLRWCRVLTIQDTGRVADPLDPSATVPLSRDNQILVSLRGPDWPWRPTTSGNSVSNDLRVAVVPGVVAVHTKTMRLGADEGLEWAID